MRQRLNFLTTMGLAVVLLLALGVSVQGRVNDNQIQAKPIMLSGEVEVQFETDVNVDRLTTAKGRLEAGVTSLDRIFDKYRVAGADALFPWRKGENAKTGNNDMARFFVLTLPEDVNVLDVIDELQKNPYIRTVSPVYAIPVRKTSDDSYRLNQWAITKIQAASAWDVETGSEDVVFADIDIGVNYEHEDLVDNIWVNPAEDADGDMVVWDTDDFDYLDSPDDPTAYVDDIVGYDFFTGFSGIGCADLDCGTPDNEPSDYDGHGTHVGGIVAAVTNNALGVSGLAGGWGGGNGPDRGVRIMCVRVGAYATDGLGYVNSANCATGVDYAVAMGADIINASWGADSWGLVTAFENAAANDIVVTHAAGNEDEDNADLVDTRYYNGHKLLLSVASSDAADLKSDFSNYGAWVDITAPGTNILSTYSTFGTPSYVYAGGTSMAAPYVAALAALIRSHMPELTKVEIDSIICATADPMPSESYYLAGLMGAGRINAYSALSSFPIAAFDATSAVFGPAPLTVDFVDESPNSPTSWTWDFGDGENAYTQNISHVFTEYGLYDVSLTVTEPRGTHTDIKRHMVMVTADTLRLASISAPPDTLVHLKVYVDNKYQAEEIILPLDLNVGSNKAKLVDTGLSVEGLDRTGSWENVGFLNYDTWNNRYVISMRPNLLEGSNYLQPDTGVVLNILVQILSGAQNGDIISFDTTSAFGPSKALKFKSIYHDYTPVYIPGQILVAEATPGDANLDGDINLLDILALIEFLYGSGTPVDPVGGDYNVDGSINLLDILDLISAIYG